MGQEGYQPEACSSPQKSSLLGRAAACPWWGYLMVNQRQRQDCLLRDASLGILLSLQTFKV